MQPTFITKDAIAFAVAALSPDLLDQYRDLAKASLETGVFSDPIPNNSAFVLLPRSVNSLDYMNSIAGDLLSLNQLNCEMAVYCLAWLEKSLPPNEQLFAQLHDIAKAWIENSRLGRHYVGARAGAAFALGAKIACCNTVLEFPLALADLLYRIPIHLKASLRIHVLCKRFLHDPIVSFLHRRFANSTNLSSLFERLDIEKITSFGRLKSTSLIAVQFRNSDDIVALQDLFDFAVELGEAFGERIGERAFELMVSPRATVAQGIGGYKVFAQILGVLDCEYSAETGFAFLSANEELISFKSRCHENAESLPTRQVRE